MRRGSIQRVWVLGALFADVQDEVPASACSSWLQAQKSFFLTTVCLCQKTLKPFEITSVQR